MTETARPRWYHLDYGGVVMGLVFVGFSLTPSLLPRPIEAQGIITGLSFGSGYMVGAFIWFLIKRAVRWRPPRYIRRSAWGYVLAMWIAGASTIGALAVEWQNDVRAHLGLGDITGLNWVQFSIYAIVTTFVCLSLGRRVRKSSQRSYRIMHSYLGARIRPRAAKSLAFMGTTVVVGATLTAAFAVVVAAGLTAVDWAYARKYADPRPSLVMPSSEYRSAGPDSVVDWTHVGRDGADILSSAPTAAQIAELTGLEAKEPIRVYVGLRNAPTPEERSALAVAELKRLRAEQRSVLIVAGTTGTGWLDPAAIDAVEYLHAGDTALVAVQYADTPSWRSSIFQPEVPLQAERTLFSAVHAWWSSLPVDDRPLLIVYGMSLGSGSMQGAFADVDDLLATVDGAIFAGTPAGTPLWEQITASRDEGSPVVRPVIDEGRHIRFFSQRSDFADAWGTWERPRIAYLQHGSDPVTWGSWSIFYREPEWMRPGQRSDQVSDHVRWIPFVSGFQLFVDFNLGQTVPGDAGHKYGNVTLDAWIAVTGTAEGMTPQSVQAIRDLIATYDVLTPLEE